MVGERTSRSPARRSGRRARRGNSNGRADGSTPQSARAASNPGVDGWLTAQMVLPFARQALPTGEGVSDSARRSATHQTDQRGFSRRARSPSLKYVKLETRVHWNLYNFADSTRARLPTRHRARPLRRRVGRRRANASSLTPFDALCVSPLFWAEGQYHYLVRPPRRRQRYFLDDGKGGGRTYQVGAPSSSRRCAADGARPLSAGARLDRLFDPSAVDPTLERPYVCAPTSAETSRSGGKPAAHPSIYEL